MEHPIAVSLFPQVPPQIYGQASMELPQQLNRLDAPSLHRIASFIPAKPRVTHSLARLRTHSIMSFILLPSHTHTRARTPQPLTQVPIIKLGGTQGRRFISLRKGGRKRRKLICIREKSELRGGEEKKQRQKAKDNLADLKLKLN